MTAVVVLVGLGAADHSHASRLRAICDHVAFLQVGEPSLSSSLTSLADAGVSEIVLVGFSAERRSSLRSWLRRVASHWLREYDGGLPVLRMSTELLATPSAVLLEAALRRTRVVGDGSAPLRSPAWERVPGHRHQVYVCRGPRCTARGADRAAAALDAELGRHGLGDDDVLVTMTGCQFPCNQAPVVVVHPDDVWYGGVGPSEVGEIVSEHLVSGEPVSRLRLPRG